MAISNQPDTSFWRVACFRLLLKILVDFQFGVYWQSYVALPSSRFARRRHYATTHSRDRRKQKNIN